MYHLLPFSHFQPAKLFFSSQIKQRVFHHTTFLDMYRTHLGEWHTYAPQNASYNTPLISFLWISILKMSPRNSVKETIAVPVITNLCIISCGTSIRTSVLAQLRLCLARMSWMTFENNGPKGQGIPRTLLFAPPEPSRPCPSIDSGNELWAQPRTEVNKDEVPRGHRQTSPRGPHWYNPTGTGASGE